MNDSIDSIIASAEPADDIGRSLGRIAPGTAAPPAGRLPVTMIEPPSGWQLVNVRELWRYRELLYFLTWRDVKVRYKQTLLGAAWAVLQPFVNMVVFSLFFARLTGAADQDVPYPVYVFTGFL